MRRVSERIIRRLPEIVWMGLIATALCLIVYELTGDETFARVLLLLMALYHVRFNYLRDRKAERKEQE